MAYFLGKDSPGDLASVLSGAYNLSSSSTTTPINVTQPAAPVGQTTTQSVDPNKGPKCHQQCRQKYEEGTQEFERCFDICMGEDPGESPQGCDANHPCPTGKKCVNGTCVSDTGPTPPPNTACPEGSGTAYEGCACGEGYSTLTGKCPTGYVFIKRDNPNDWKSGIPYKEGAIGTCQCQKAIDDWKEKKAGQLGEYKYPAEMQSLMDLLLSRGKEFLGLAPGYSQEAQDKMFGRGFENVRGQEAGQRTALESGLSRQGMLGTGAGQGMLNDLAWQTEGNVANLARDLFIANEEKKKQDLLDYTTAAQSVLGGGMNFQQLLEAINASRRGEGSAALQSLLAWLLSQK